MPHLILECSDNIAAINDFKTLFQQLHQLLAAALPTQISSCKSRVITYGKYYIGANFENNSFLHLTIKIMPGRTDAVKSSVGKQVLNILNQLIQDLNISNAAISVEIIDLTTNYFKIG